VAISVRRRVQKRRENLRALGLRPVQIWLPDTRGAGFAEECARQAKLTAESDQADRDLNVFLDEALTDLDDLLPQEP
jgi:hypothetical protein